MASNRHQDKETHGITAVMILEIIGKPPEHLVDTLKDLIKKMDSEKGIVVQDSKIHEPQLMKDRKDFYTTFAEVEVQAEEVMDLSLIMFKYTPANVEIIRPELIALTNSGWSEILSEVIRRLHGYDEVARILQNEKAMLETKLREIMDKEKKKVPEEKEE